MIRNFILGTGFYLSITLLFIYPLHAQEVQEQLSQQNSSAVSDSVDTTSKLPSTITAPADTRYETSDFVEFFLGSHYRDIWGMPVTFDVLDLNNFEGGVDIYNVGGGQQTTTLFMRTNEGSHLVGRTIPKNPVVLSGDLEDPFQIMINNSVIRDILQDQISTAHPYGPLASAPIAKAAGLYYNNLKAMYLPDQESDNEIPETAKNVPIMIENFIDLDFVRENFEPNATERISTIDAITRIIEDSNYKIDAEWYLKTRLMSMLLGDWDRHEGQYFWIVVPGESERMLLRPFPLDHDNNFFVMTGLIPSRAYRARSLRKFQHFHEDITEINGLNEQSRYMDELFLVGLDKSRWIKITEKFKQDLTDQVLENAINQMPEKVRESSGDQILSDLKSRRDDMAKYAMEYYETITMDVDVVGTVDNNIFKLSELTSGHYSVSATTVNGVELFNREIDPDDIRSVRFFGIGGKNEFIFDLAEKVPFQVHIVENNDDIADTRFTKSYEPGNIKFHREDLHWTEDISFKFNTAEFSSDLLEKYGFNYQEAADDLLVFSPSMRFNSDDGFSIGLRGNYTTYRFRKYPFSTNHGFVARFSTLTRSYDANYSGEFTNFWGPNDLVVKLFIQAPNFQQNFYGLGNDTEKRGDSGFHDVRRDIFGIETGFVKRISVNREVNLTATYNSVKLDTEFDKFFLRPEAGLSDSDFDVHKILGFKTSYRIQLGDKSLFPRDKFELQANGHLTHNFLDSSTMFSLSGALVGSKSLLFNDLVFATRVGSATNIGDFRFFQSHTLGDVGSFLRSNSGFFVDANFRGLPRDRFSGRTIFYHNNDLRAKLFTIDAYILPGDFGIIGLFDHGRAWAPGENSNTWHYSYGGGIWYNFYKKFMVSTTYSQSDVDSSLSIILGFLF